MKGRVEHIPNPEAVVAAAAAIQDAMGANILAIILIDFDGRISSIPNPNLDPADVFRALAVQNWDASARVAEEYR